MRALLLLLVVALALPARADAPVEVRLAGGAYAPHDVQARAGDAIRFVNADDVPHTVTSAWDGGATVDKVLRPGESVTLVFDEAGTYTLRCLPHSAAQPDGSYQGMVATVHVAAAGTSHAPRAWEMGALYAGVALIGASLLVWRARRARPGRPATARAPGRGR
ncbi:MAG: hypothetical protein QOE90_2228 [Thermoplasmata archaeon]|nr:hypothetical protein [Thermoplasmata archaeon]